jgi:hypothetical protein
VDVNYVSDNATASEDTLNEMDVDLKRSVTMEEHWWSASERFKNTFVNNPFVHECDVCDRLWFLRDLKPVKSKYMLLLHNKFPGEAVADFQLCSACRKSLDNNKILNLSRLNGSNIHQSPADYSPLDPISARLNSPRLPFVQILRLRYENNYGIVSQIINVPVDVNTMVQQLPMRLDDDHVFNVNIKKKLIHKSTYVSGFMKKSVVKAWLRYLINQPLYKHNNIKINWEAFGFSYTRPMINTIVINY